MSTTQIQNRTAESDDPPALGARGDWYGEDDADAEDSPVQPGDKKYRDNGQGDEWGIHYEFSAGTDPAEKISFDILRDYAGASEICGRTLVEDPWNGGRVRELFAWLDPDGDPEGWPVDGRGDQLHRKNRSVELTDPELMPPWITAARCRNLRRYQPDTGYINWSETTWVLLEDVDKDQFMTGVREWLEHHHPGLGEGEQRQALNLASTRKSDPDLDDVDALTFVVRKVRQQKARGKPNPFSKPGE